MCERTVPNSYAGDSWHRKHGEKPCRECRDAANEKNRAWQKTRSAQTLRAAHLWANYRIKLAEYRAIIEAQNGCCGICSNPLPEYSRSVHVDHVHGCEHEGRGWYCCAACVRGVLCQRCNTSLAILEDQEWMKQAIAYLDGSTTADVLRRLRLF